MQHNRYYCFINFKFLTFVDFREGEKLLVLNYKLDCIIMIIIIIIIIIIIMGSIAHWDSGLCELTACLTSIDHAIKMIVEAGKGWYAAVPNIAGNCQFSSEKTVTIHILQDVWRERQPIVLWIVWSSLLRLFLDLLAVHVGCTFEEMKASYLCSIEARVSL